MGSLRIQERNCALSPYSVIYYFRIIYAVNKFFRESINRSVRVTKTLCFFWEAGTAVLHIIHVNLTLYLVDVLVELLAKGTSFWGAFKKLRTATISFIMSACQSVRPSAWKQLGSHWTDFDEIRY